MNNNQNLYKINLIYNKHKMMKNFNYNKMIF